MAENGAVIEVTRDRAGITDYVEAGMVFVDGLGVGDVGETVLRDRRHLAEDGVVVVVAAVDHHTGKSVGTPEIISRGFVYAPESEDLLERAREHVRQTIDRGNHPRPGGRLPPKQDSQLAGQAPVPEDPAPAGDPADRDGGLAPSTTPAQPFVKGCLRNSRRRNRLEIRHG